MDLFLIGLGIVNTSRTKADTEVNQTDEALSFVNDTALDMTDLTSSWPRLSRITVAIHSTVVVPHSLRFV